ncbi:uncharacterized protein [Ptychodera flava]|uniref:uncharacterized protein n=1 Tax=Ptychodera flava TaxID=63121 RepID=UPI003969DBE1
MTADKLLRLKGSAFLTDIELPQTTQEIPELYANDPEEEDVDEAKNLRSPVKKTSPLYRLDPYLDKDGIIRVGGRIRQANLPREITHPVLLPKQEYITKSSATVEIRPRNELVYAKGELVAALAEMDKDKIRQELLKDNCNRIKFEMNIPYSSHMGGVWERMIRSARNALTSLMVKHAYRLHNELLRTPLVESSSDSQQSPTDLQRCEFNRLTRTPISKSIIDTEAKGGFTSARQLRECRYILSLSWRRVQYLANEFRRRWKTEFLPTQQQQKKWVVTTPNLQKDDIVFVVDEKTPRCQWPIASVVETFQEKTIL